MYNKQQRSIRSPVLAIIEFNIANSKNKIKYINIPTAFDIETSSFYNPDKAACMYIWMMGLNNDYVIYGRTWQEWLQAVYVIAGELQLGADKKLIIYVHNLSYEFNWIRKYFS